MMLGNLATNNLTTNKQHRLHQLDGKFNDINTQVLSKAGPTSKTTGTTHTGTEEMLYFCTENSRRPYTTS